MLNPLYDFVLLGFESASVINKRILKIGLGGTQSVEEIGLMFSEKATASLEAMFSLMMGGTHAGMVARFREQVAENEARLSL